MLAEFSDSDVSYYVSFISCVNVVQISNA